jgi:hypothetical protein
MVPKRHHVKIDASHPRFGLLSWSIHNKNATTVEHMMHSPNMGS